MSVEKKNTLKTTHSDKFKTTLYLWIHWYHPEPRQEVPFPRAYALKVLPSPSSGTHILPGQGISGTKGPCPLGSCALPF